MQTIRIDLTGAEDPHRDPRRAGDHGPKQLLAFIGCELFRIVQGRERPHAMIAEAGIVEQHTGDHERAGKGSPPRLVRTRDEARAKPAIEAEQPLSRAEWHGDRG